jgi:hypothetical protein
MSLPPTFFTGPDILAYKLFQERRITEQGLRVNPGFSGVIRHISFE